MISTGNKKTIYLLASAFIFIVLFFTSCAYDTEVSYLNDQIVALNNRVTKLQQSIDQAIDQKIDQKLEPQSKAINSNRAEITVEIDQLKGEIQGLSGRVEDNEHVIKSAVEKDLSEQESIRRDLDKLDNLIQRIEKLEATVNRQSEYLGLESSRAGEPGQGQVKAPPQEQQVQTAVGEQKSEESGGIYDRSLSLYREGKYEEAMEGFKRFLRENPQSDLADNAQFWIGECYMSLKQTELAILAYQEVIKKYPKGNKVPNAMLRQAVAFLEINDKTSAQIVLKQLIKQFPDSSEAKIAETKLKQIE